MRDYEEGSRGMVYEEGSGGGLMRGAWEEGLAGPMNKVHEEGS
jgi:hypothetical protein